VIDDRLHLLADLANAVDGVVRLRELVADLQEEGVLLAVVFGRRGQTRVAAHLQRLRQRLAFGGEAHGVGAGGDARPACAARPEDQPLEPARVR
jgi:hypothetical protein